MSADIDKRTRDRLDATCVLKNVCAFCGEPLWFCRSERTRKLVALEASGRNHFARVGRSNAR